MVVCETKNPMREKMNTFNGKQLLTPKDLAEALGASESSIRRWVDNGDIRIARTAGGHRRIPLAEAIRYIRQIGAAIVQPDLLGLGELKSRGVDGLRLSDAEALFDGLQDGDGERVRSLLVARYLQGQNLSSLFDGPVLEAMRQIGELWNHDQRGILIEHRATEICIDAIGVLRRLLPPVEAGSPVALGGAPQGDPYQLPSMMAGTALLEAGFRDVNFGANTPIELLGKEAIERRASLVWISFSAPCEPKAGRASVKKLAGDLAKHNIRLFVGGRHRGECVSHNQPNMTLIESMTELAELAAAKTPRSETQTSKGEL